MAAGPAACSCRFCQSRVPPVRWKTNLPDAEAGGTHAQPVQTRHDGIRRLDPSTRCGPPLQTTTAPGDGLEDDAWRGVVAIDIREVVARFSGTLLLNELPRRQPEVVFDRGRQSRDDDDE